MDTDQIDEQLEHDTNIAEAEKDTNIAAEDESMTRNSILRELGEPLENSDSLRLDVDRIIEYAKAHGATSRDDVLFELRKLSARVGAHQLGDKAVKHLSRYIYLLSEKTKVDEEISSFETL